MAVMQPWENKPHNPQMTQWGEPKSKPEPQTPFEIMDKVLSQLTTRGIGFHNHEPFFKELVNMNYPRATYPPFDILSTGDESYEIRLALAGFSRDDLEITFQEQVLTISGSKEEENTDSYFHKGIGGRDFKQSFPLAEYIEITDAVMKDGILTISLDRKVPEEMKPKTIKIK